MKYKTVEPPPPSEQEKALQDIEATILAHLKELALDDMSKAEGSSFEDWLACEQALIQVGQMRALQGIYDMLYRWNQTGVPVYAIAT